MPGGPSASFHIRTARTLLRPWRDEDASAFAAMNADLAVMVDMPALTRAESDTKLARYRAAYARHGLCRWRLEDRGGGFLGYVGLMPMAKTHPLGAGFEIGWRLVRSAWGQGYVTEAARAALEDAFQRARLAQVYSFTAPDNLRSQAVMTRLKLERRPELDFTDPPGPNGWRGLVWSAAAG